MSNYEKQEQQEQVEQAEQAQKKADQMQDSVAEALRQIFMNVGSDANLLVERVQENNRRMMELTTKLQADCEVIIALAEAEEAAGTKPTDEAELSARADVIRMALEIDNSYLGLKDAAEALAGVVLSSVSWQVADKDDADAVDEDQVDEDISTVVGILALGEVLNHHLNLGWEQARLAEGNVLNRMWEAPAFGEESN